MVLKIVILWKLCEIRAQKICFDENYVKIEQLLEI